MLRGHLAIHLILAAAVLCGTAQVQPYRFACSFDVCGRECPMHTPKPAEPFSCCAKEKPVAPAKCQCSIGTNDRSEAIVAKVMEPPPSEVLLIPATLVDQGDGRIIEKSARFAPLCHGPPGGRVQAPDLGRAPPAA